MDEKLKLLKTFREGNIIGEIWEVSYFSSEDGNDLGVVYELGLGHTYSRSSQLLLDKKDLQDCLHVFQRAIPLLYPMGIPEEELLTY